MGGFLQFVRRVYEFESLKQHYPVQSQGGGHQGIVILVFLNNAGSEHSRLGLFVGMCYPLFRPYTQVQLLGSNEEGKGGLSPGNFGMGGGVGNPS